MRFVSLVRRQACMRTHIVPAPFQELVQTKYSRAETRSAGDEGIELTRSRASLSNSSEQNGIFKFSVWLM
jgi:hypothetical protein